jgi:PAS domain S-box-containing protein
MTDTETRSVATIRTELERLHALADNVPAMLVYWGRDRRCEYANQALETWAGNAAGTVVGRSMPEVLGELYERHLPYITAAFAGEEQRFDCVIPSPDGAPRQGQVHYVPDVVAGVVRGIYVLVADVTHRAKADDAVRNVERQAHATERLAAIATLTQSIAHEINNPLAIALLGLDDAIDQIDQGTADPAAMRDSLVSAREGMNRMVGIVHSMKLLARLDTTQRERVDVKAILEESLTLATTEIRYRAHLAAALEDVGFVDGNAAQLSQVFVSVLMNVAKALPEEHSEHNQIRVSARRDRGSIVVEIADNARAASSEVAQRAFDRFFTTTDQAGGIGLGLSVARDVVTTLGGTIGVETTTEGGTVFRIVLPPAPEQLVLPSAAPPPPSESPAHSSSYRGLGRRGRILVVDDEPLVGRSLKRHLSPSYDVETVTRGREAVERSLDERYDVILCDLMMPDVSGADVYTEVTAARPDLAERFIFMTGGAFTARGREFLHAIAAPVLAKPFDLPVLDATVRRIATSAQDDRETPTAMGRPGSRD